MRSSSFRFGGIFILCVNLWRYFHLMGSPIATLWGHGQSKSLFVQTRHSHVMRKPTQRRREKKSSSYRRRRTREKKERRRGRRRKKKKKTKKKNTHPAW